MNASRTPGEQPDETAGARSPEVQSLLDDADERDEQADRRDSKATERDSAADLVAFMDPDADYDKVSRTRRAAAMDRESSKHDRRSSADDRSKLAPEDEPTASN